jgi:hypothetical protein
MYICIRNSCIYIYITIPLSSGLFDIGTLTVTNTMIETQTIAVAGRGELGASVGVSGLRVGDIVGAREGNVVGVVAGVRVRFSDGVGEGAWVRGDIDGTGEGLKVMPRDSVGTDVGASEGSDVGSGEGFGVGGMDGDDDGRIVGGDRFEG